MVDEKHSAQIFIDLLREKKIRCVVFDLDHTATTMHSGGVLNPYKAKQYIALTSHDFVQAVPALLDSGFFVAMASFTDSRSYDYDQRQRGFLAGQELIRFFLESHFSRQIADRIFCIGYFPAIDHQPLTKNLHMQTVIRHFAREELMLRECVLFDDSLHNVRNSDGFLAYSVSKLNGFRFSDLK